MDNFWLDDYKVLYKDTNYLYFFPTNTMSRIEQLNAISRFCIYLLILFLLFSNDSNWLYVPIVLLMLVVAFYYIDQYDKLVNKQKGGHHGCSLPTRDNPFMNITVDEYQDNVRRPKACDINDPTIKEDIDNKFNHNLYKDLDEVFNTKNSQREFYTMPNTTIPNKQKEFAQWLFRVPTSCKVDQERCLRYEDLRYKGYPLYYK